MATGEVKCGEVGKGRGSELAPHEEWDTVGEDGGEYGDNHKDIFTGFGYDYSTPVSESKEVIGV